MSNHVTVRITPARTRRDEAQAAATMFRTTHQAAVADETTYQVTYVAPAGTYGVQVRLLTATQFSAMPVLVDWEGDVSWHPSGAVGCMVSEGDAGEVWAHRFSLVLTRAARAARAASRVA